MVRVDLDVTEDKRERGCGFEHPFVERRFERGAGTHEDACGDRILRREKPEQMGLLARTVSDVTRLEGSYHRVDEPERARFIVDA